MKLRFVAVALGLLAPALAGCLSVPPPPDTYVALGDSYTAGPVIPNQIRPYGCLKSDHDYPHLVAPSDGLPKFVDMSCSGAKTDDMTAPQEVDFDGPNPPQFTPLNNMTGLVTITIGGNDIGFTDIAINCGTPVPAGHPCQDKYVVNGVDTIRQTIDATAPKVAAVLQGIHNRAPRARVIVLAYDAILPEDPLVPGTPEGCYPQMPLAPEDVPYLRGVQKYLNDMIEAQASANGAEFIDMYALSIGHDACQLPGTRWVEPVTPTSPAAPVHPNQLGMNAARDAVLAEL